MKNLKNIGLVSVVMSSIFLSGCIAGPEQGSVKILSIKPDQNSIIRVNDRLDVEVTVEYNLKSDKGQISLLIQNDDAKEAGRHIGASEQELVASSGTLILKQSIIVPETTKIGVYTPIYVGGRHTKTSIVDSRTFTVSPKK